jgi:hypothetical protein
MACDTPAGLAEGIYFIRVVFEDGRTVVRKVVKG